MEVYTSDRRNSPRLQLKTPLRVRVWKSGPAEQLSESENLSERGTFFATDAPLAIGVAVEILLRMPEEITGKPAIEWRCTGHVVRLQPITLATSWVWASSSIATKSCVPKRPSSYETSCAASWIGTQNFSHFLVATGIPLRRIRRWPAALRVPFSGGDCTEQEKDMQRRALVVDDEQVVCQLIGKILNSAGIEALTLTRSTEAPEILEEGIFDVVFLDLHMPSPDGIDLARQMRSSRSNRSTPIIMISDDQRPSALAVGFAAGASFFLYKPSTRITF